MLSHNKFENIAAKWGDVYFKPNGEVEYYNLINGKFVKVSK